MQPLVDHSAQAEPPFQRKSANVGPAIITWMLSWGMGSACMCAATCPARHRMTVISQLIRFAIMVTFALAWWFWTTAIRPAASPDGRMATGWLRARYWPRAFLVLAACLCTAGTIIGDIAYFEYLRPYYDAVGLQSYTNVNPSWRPRHDIVVGSTGLVDLVHGRDLKARVQTTAAKVPMGAARFQDAGVVRFETGTRADAGRAGGFRQGSTHCVAPLVLAECAATAGPAPAYCGFDFFAAGVDCCDSSGAQFSCAPQGVTGGLRVVDASRRSLLHLALLSAQQEHPELRRADHPVFFDMLNQPAASLDDWFRGGVALLLQGALGGFLLSGLLVGALYKLGAGR